MPPPSPSTLKWRIATVAVAVVVTAIGALAITNRLNVSDDLKQLRSDPLANMSLAGVERVSRGESDHGKTLESQPGHTLFLFTPQERVSKSSNSSPRRSNSR